MKKQRLALVLVLLLVTRGSAADGFRCQSPDLSPGGRVPAAQLLADCGGQNRSPGLSWSGAPGGTKSYAITFFDFDAPGGKGFWHWVVFDLGLPVHALAAGASSSGLPAGAKQSRNDYGTRGYGGPCPPPGTTHHYQLTVYALDVERLPAPAGGSAAEMAALIQRHALAKTGFTAIFGH